jgi:triosephosphate isomerase
MSSHEVLKIGAFSITNRLFVGTGKYATYELMKEALAASGAQVVTVAVRRERMTDQQGRNILDFVDPARYILLPNTAGCFNADDAVRTAILGRELLEGLSNRGAAWVKLEVLGDKKTLLPDPMGTLEALKVLKAEGFTVLCYTSDDPIMAMRLKDAGAAAVIVGHSERRHYHGETDADVRAKALAARRAGLLAIVCVGETRAEREAGRALAVVGAQLDGSLPDEAGDFVVAYEPIWAIGTGLTPTASDIAGMHRSIREWLVSRSGGAGETTRILYGGSVNPKNAKALLAVDNVDGALVGGASLKAAEFLAIAGVYA